MDSNQTEELTQKPVKTSSPTVLQPVKSKSTRRKNRDRAGREPGTALIPHTEAEPNNLLELYTCFRKVGYILQADAKAAIHRLHSNEIASMSSYICVYCTGWHIGHTPTMRDSPGRRRKKLLRTAAHWWNAHPTDADTLSRINGLIK